ncbi:uncharacterized protein EI90DRAFT_3041534 [Cantharellus anzutake]|uniref:uncharacterized protein n=1 Tax=Cantharellus anzutake TaxID=1750568 RepID=UPI0019039660|nr:uncharacterized protein EI90DRAFT_3041534 [Cantharellus anzutake]KAF8338081.1 hypothetical protein EI90DRAFT_3041534 [Cantharellus anzutake]
MSSTDAINSFANKNGLFVDWTFTSELAGAPNPVLWTCTCFVGNKTYVGGAFSKQKAAKNDASKLACNDWGVTVQA